MLALLAGATWTGCGRIGFEALPDELQSAGPIGAPPSEPGDETAGEAGTEPPLDTDSSDGGPADDGSVPADGGVEGPGGPRDSCKRVPDALACANFNRGDWPGSMLDRTKDGYLDASEGYLEAETWATDGWARLSASFAPVQSGTLYLRMSMLVPWDADLTLVNFAELTAPGVGSTGVDFNFRFDELEVYSHENDEHFVASGFSIPRDEWFCFLAEIDLGAGDGAVRTFIEDTQLHDEGRMSTLPPDGIGETQFGLAWVGSDQSSAHVIIDDFALSSAPLGGCP